MNVTSQKSIFIIVLLMLFGQQAVLADKKPHPHQGPPGKHFKAVPPAHQPYGGKHFDDRRYVPPPGRRNYYKPGYRVNPLPYGSRRIFVRDREYFFYDGYFYQPYGGGGYVIVNAPIGAIVAALPRLHLTMDWLGQPFYVFGNTFYRKHPGGYIVVPDPGFGHRR